jgi:hypothetical protein
MSLTRDNSTTSNFAVIYAKKFYARQKHPQIHIYTKANIAPLVIAFVGHNQIGRESEQ